MNLYIKTENGQALDHPVFEDNLIHALGTIPEHWEPFMRVEPPIAGEYEVVEHPPNYQKINGVWTDIWTVRPMTNEERAAKDQKTKDDARALAIYSWKIMPAAENFTAWILNEETLKYEPPTPRPEDGKKYFWQGTTNSWVERPPFPDDGKTYRFDFPLGAWIEVTE